MKLLNRMGLLDKVNLDCSISINGKLINIPIIKGIGYGNLNLSEQWMLKLLERILKAKNGLFIDIGVNIGQTLIKLRSVDEKVDYIGFEPNPSCVYYSQELIKANDYKNSVIMPVGLFSEDGLMELDFYADSSVDSSASLVKDYRPSQPVIFKTFVPVFSYDSLDKWLPDINESISCVKIDVEGAELEVLQAIAPLIRKHRPYILIEVLPVYNEENITRLDRQKKIELLLSDMEYLIYRVNKSNEEFSDLELIQEFGVHSNLDCCDYVLMPNEIAKNI